MSQIIDSLLTRQHNWNEFFISIQCYIPDKILFRLVLIIRSPVRTPASYLCWAQLVGNTISCHAGHKRSAGFAPEVNLRNSVQVGKTSPEVQNRGIGGCPPKKKKFYWKIYIKILHSSWIQSEGIMVSKIKIKVLSQCPKIHCFHGRDNHYSANLIVERSVSLWALHICCRSKILIGEMNLGIISKIWREFFQIKI